MTWGFSSPHSEVPFKGQQKRRQKAAPGAAWLCLPGFPEAPCSGAMTREERGHLLARLSWFSTSSSSTPCPTSSGSVLFWKYWSSWNLISCPCGFGQASLTFFFISEKKSKDTRVPQNSFEEGKQRKHSTERIYLFCDLILERSCLFSYFKKYVFEIAMWKNYMLFNQRNKFYQDNGIGAKLQSLQRRVMLTR